MPCMCGDPYCWSCGPAQGNYKCEICGAWTEDGGCKNPEECNKKSKEWADSVVRDFLESDLLETLAKEQNCEVCELNISKEWWKEINAMTFKELDDYVKKRKGL